MSHKYQIKGNNERHRYQKLLSKNKEKKVTFPPTMKTQQELNMPKKEKKERKNLYSYQ